MSKIVSSAPEISQSFLYKHRIKLGITTFIVTFVTAIFVTLALLHAHHLFNPAMDWMNAHPFAANVIEMSLIFFTPLVLVWGSYCIAICLV